MSNINYKWVFNNKYGTKVLKSVNIKDNNKIIKEKKELTKTNDSDTPNAYLLTINTVSMGDGGTPWSTIGGIRMILGQMGDLDKGLKYLRFNLQEKLQFSVDVDLSHSSAGCNLALYFVPMCDQIKNYTKDSSLTKTEIQNNIKNDFLKNYVNEKTFLAQGQEGKKQRYYDLKSSTTDCYWQSFRGLIPSNSINTCIVKGCKSTVLQAVPPQWVTSRENFNNTRLKDSNCDQDQTVTYDEIIKYLINNDLLEACGFGYNDAQSYGDGVGSTEIDVIEATPLGFQTTGHFDTTESSSNFQTNLSNVTVRQLVGNGNGSGFRGPQLKSCKTDDGGLLSPFSVINNGSNKLTYTDMHGIFSNTSRINNTIPNQPDYVGVLPSKPNDERRNDVGGIIPALKLFAPSESATINTLKPFRVHISTDFMTEEGKNYLKICSKIEQDDKFLSVTNQNTTKCPINDSNFIQQLTQQSLVISYWQTSANDELGDGLNTSWWLDGSNKDDIRGIVTGKTEGVGAENVSYKSVPTNVDVQTAITDLKIKNNNLLTYEYSITGQSLIDQNTGPAISRMKKLIPSFVQLGNFQFKKTDALKNRIYTKKLYFTIDSMYRGIDALVNGGIWANYHGTMAGTYGVGRVRLGDWLPNGININNLNSGKNWDDNSGTPAEDFVNEMQNMFSGNNTPIKTFQKYVASTFEAAGMSEINNPDIYTDTTFKKYNCNTILKKEGDQLVFNKDIGNLTTKNIITIND